MGSFWRRIAGAVWILLAVFVVPAAFSSVTSTDYVYDLHGHAKASGFRPTEHGPSAAGREPRRHFGLGQRDYDDPAHYARTNAFDTSGLLAPQTARAVHASDLVESPLWTATKSRTSAQNAYRHFADHGADFPDIQNSLEYVAKAQNFLRTPPGGTLTRVRTNGDVVRWHPGSNTFGVMDAGGAPRTFFRPDPSVHGYANNWDYFYAQ